jgi:hypothetical protein
MGWEAGVLVGRCEQGGIEDRSPAALGMRELS